jgi:predicted enzyme related to lactoylglutathione lyase
MGVVVETLTVGIPVSNLESATEWYRRLLPEKPESDPGPGVHEFELRPGLWLQLLETETQPRSESIVRIGVADVEHEHARAEGLGVDTSGILTVPGVVRHFEFRDPWGNRMGFYEIIAPDGCA